MKRAIVVAIAALMIVCVLPMAQGQESASSDVKRVIQDEIIRVNVEERDRPSEDQMSRDLKALQQHLDQMVVQQKELQNQLRALTERRHAVSSEQEQGDQLSQDLSSLKKHLDELTIQQKVLQEQLRALARERQPLAEVRRERQREPGEGRGGGGLGPRRERVEEDIDVTIPPGIGPVDGEVRRGGGQPRAYETPERRHDVKRERERALDEVTRALEDVRRSAGEVRARVHRQYADRIKAWGSEMNQWQQSEQMQQWRREMENWQKQMQEWAHSLVHRQRDAEGSSPEAAKPAPAPPMPPMPEMPKMPAPVPGPLEEDLDLEMDMGNLDIDVQVPEIRTPRFEITRIEPPVPPIPPEISAEAQGLEEAVHHAGFSSIPGDAVLEVVNHVGSITVRSDDVSAYEVRATIKGRAETEERAREIAEQVKITETGLQNDGTDRILVSKAEGLKDRENCIVTLEVTAPRNARLKLRQEVGDIRLVGLRGSVEAFDRVGSIRATDVAGKVALNVEVGGIEFTAPRDLSARVKAKADLGGIRSDLPLELTKTDGLAMGHSASGTIGQGDDTISLNTRMGSIHIRSQASEPGRAGGGRPGSRSEPRPEPRPEGEF